MPFRQMIYLPKKEKPLLASDACSFRVMCRLYGTERSESVVVYGECGNISEAEFAAEMMLAKLGFTVDPCAVWEKCCGFNDWQLCYDERGYSG